MIISLDVIRKQIATERALLNQIAEKHGINNISDCAIIVFIDGECIAKPAEWILKNATGKRYNISENDILYATIAVMHKKIKALEATLEEELKKRKRP